jgi:hypothetical protein
MEALIVPFLLVVLALLAYRFGHDSGPHLRSREDELARSGFAFDHETLTVGTDAAVPGPSPTMRTGSRVVVSRAG